jgi:hypothetical protein
MPSTQEWVYTDVVSGETATLPSAGLPDRWAIVDGDCHGPRGLFIIAQRLINQVIPGNATYDQAATTPYDSASALDAGYTIPEGL